MAPTTMAPRAISSPSSQATGTNAVSTAAPSAVRQTERQRRSSSVAQSPSALVATQGSTIAPATVPRRPWATAPVITGSSP